MLETNGTENERREGPPTLEEYLLMSDIERDREIEKGLLRLQKRIQEILYIVETEQKQ